MQYEGWLLPPWASAWTTCADGEQPPSPLLATKSLLIVHTVAAVNLIPSLFMIAL